MPHELRKNVVYRNGEPQFAIERQDNCIALIPMRMLSDLLDEMFAERAAS